LLGGVLQLAVQLPVLYKKGFRFRFTRALSHPAVSRVFRLMGPRLFSSAIYQLNISSIPYSGLWRSWSVKAGSRRFIFRTADPVPSGDIRYFTFAGHSAVFIVPSGQ
jgi:hypothetical protein